MIVWVLWPIIGWIMMAIFVWAKYNNYQDITRGDIAGAFFTGALGGPFWIVFAAIVAITSIKWNKTVFKKGERW